MSNKDKDKTEESDTAVMVTRGNANLTRLPANIQAALAKFKTRELEGFAPQWKPTKEGEFIIGQVVSAREGVGEYEGTVVTLATPSGPAAVFLNADLKMKLGDVNAGLVGRNFVIQFTGWLRKAENPKLKNDMKVFQVIEVEK